MLFPTLSSASRCLPDDTGVEAFASRCDVVVVSTRTPQCHVNEPWNYPYTTTDRNDNWYHVHGWNQLSLKAKNSSCDINFDDCKHFAFRQLDKFRDVNNCGYVSVGKSVEYRFRTFDAARNVESERTGRMIR